MSLAPLRINWTTDKNSRSLNRYKELGLIPFSCSINEIEKADQAPKKEMSKMPPHSQITKFKQSLIKSNNGLCIKMGTQMGDGSYVILIDIDNKNNTTEAWRSLVIKHSKSKTIKTQRATPGNKGIHYLFNVSEEPFHKTLNSHTKLTVDGNKLDIDIKGKNGPQIAEQSRDTLGSMILFTNMRLSSCHRGCST